MTVDSAYFSEVKAGHAGTEYPMEIESVGMVAFEVWVIAEDGTRTKLLNFDVPENALLDTDGNPILDTDGNYILWV